MTDVLPSAQFIAEHATECTVDVDGCWKAAETVYELMQTQKYSTEKWSEHELNPKEKTKETVDWLFLVDLLNFSFWSDVDDNDTGRPDTLRYAVEYKGKSYTGYWSLCAAVNRALDEGIPLTTPSYWKQLTREQLAYIFRPVPDQKREHIPLLDERLEVLKDAVLGLDHLGYDSFVQVVEDADGSAVKLVQLLTQHYFTNFDDSSEYKGRRVSFYKRAQILVGDLYACFNGESYGHFEDIDALTVFADYRIPQILHQIGCIAYSPRLEAALRSHELLPHGDAREVEIRGCTIWACELVRQAIEKAHPETHVNSVILDYFLWDTAKVRQSQRDGDKGVIPCHRTRSIFY